MLEQFNKDKKLHANENVKWFRLDGDSYSALMQSILLGDQITRDEKQNLRDSMGLDFLVLRDGQYYGPSKHAPEVYASPYGRKNEFFMMCPIGSRDGEEDVYFTPKGGIELEEAEISSLESGLFSPWGGSMPIIKRDPISVRSPQKEDLDHTPKIIL